MKGEQLKANNVEVYNMLGEKVYSQLAIDSGQWTIDLGNQPAGIYLYRIIDSKGAAIATGKLTVEK